MRILGLLLGLVLVATPASGAEDALARIKRTGKLRVAMDPTYPPMEMEEDSGDVAGFDVDLARELATRLGAKAEFVVMGWEGILGGLTSNRYDAIVSSMNVTAERLKTIDFVEYERMSQLFVAKPAAAFGGETDLTGKVVAVAADTTSHEWLNQRKAAGLPVKEVKAFRLTSEVFMAVKTGHADLLVVDEPVGRHYVKIDGANFQVKGRAMAPEPIGIGLRKADGALKKAVEEAVAAMRKDGTLAKLEVKWFGTALGT